MQLQIECNCIPFQQQSCWICHQSFQMTEAKVIICNDQGNGYGQVCPQCLKRGFHWLSNRFEQMDQPKATVLLRQSQNLEVPNSA